GEPAQVMTPNPYLWLVGHLWLVPLLPLAGAAINGFFGRQWSKKAISIVALVFCGAAFVMALGLAAGFSSAASPYYCDLAHWIRSGTFQVDFSFYLDQLSLVMLLVVTGVGFLIHISSGSKSCTATGISVAIPRKWWSTPFCGACPIT